jgi:phospholipid/cholesterol/gamma-HCH transport system substrate-binding protein
MMRVIRKSLKDFVLILAVMAFAAGVGAYVLAHQRLRFPWQSTPFKLNATFDTAQAVTPGQGQTVRISGVRVGDIARVNLKDGRGVVTMDVDPEYASLIHTDASALLRPKTGLKDMFIELNPGTAKAPSAKDGFDIPIANTLPDINPDEFYSALDSDTRDYLKLLVNGAGRGLQGRGADLRNLLRRFEPTHRDLARFTTAVNERRENLRRLIHNLNVLNGALANHSTDITQLVSTSSQVFRAFAREQNGIQQTVNLLPGTLQQTTSTLNKVNTFARILGPAARELVPVGPALDKANKASVPLGKEATPILRTQIRPFVRDVRPLVRNLKPASHNLADATPDLTRTFTVLNHLFNLIGYNPNGREDPTKDTREEGYLFWIAWLQHNGASAFANSDANGVFRPVTLISTCETLKETVANTPASAFVTGFTNVLTDAGICGLH